MKHYLAVPDISIFLFPFGPVTSIVITAWCGLVSSGFESKAVKEKLV